jgi:RNA polymerase sigma-70 factor (family 1)
VKNSSFNITSISFAEESFIAFYRNHYASFCFFANRFVNDSVIAEDIVGDVALRLWAKRGELQNVSALKSYFYASIRNACLDWIHKEKRKSSKETVYLQHTNHEQRNALENMIHAEVLQRVEEALRSLPPQCQKIFTKLFIEGKTLSETADEMKLSLSTIKNQRQRGIMLLRRQLIGPTFLGWVISLFL